MGEKNDTPKKLENYSKKCFVIKSTFFYINLNNFLIIFHLSLKIMSQKYEKCMQL